MTFYSTAELNEMRVTDLRKLASQLDIPGRSGATRKADLIDLILGFQQSEVMDTSDPSAPSDDEAQPLESVIDDAPQSAPTTTSCPVVENSGQSRPIFPPPNPSRGLHGVPLIVSIHFMKVDRFLVYLGTTKVRGPP